MADTKTSAKTKTQAKADTKTDASSTADAAPQANFKLGRKSVPKIASGGRTGYRGSVYPFDKLKLNADPNMFEFDPNTTKLEQVRGAASRYVKHLHEDEGVPKNDLPKFSVRKFVNDDGQEVAGCFRVERKPAKTAEDSDV